MVRIVQFSDSHYSVKPRLEPGRRADMERAVQTINSLPGETHLVLHTGDAADTGKAEEYATVRQCMDRLNERWVVLTGNRDSRKGLRETFGDIGWIPEGEAHAPVDYIVSLSPALALVAFDSKGERMNKGWADEERVGNLRAMLASVKEQGKRAVVAIHHPPYVLEEIPDPYQYEDWSHAEAIQRVIAEAGNVSVVITGHAHRYIDGEVGGVPAHTCTATASDLRKGPSKDLGDAPALMVYEFDTQGRLMGAAPFIGAPAAAE